MRSPWADHRGRDGRNVTERNLDRISSREVLDPDLRSTASIADERDHSAIRRESRPPMRSCERRDQLEAGHRRVLTRSRRRRNGVRQVGNCSDEHDRGHQGGGDNHAVGSGRGSLGPSPPGDPRARCGRWTRRRVRSCRRRPNRGPCAAGGGPAGPLPFPSDERFGRCASGRSQSPSRNQAVPRSATRPLRWSVGGSRIHRGPEVRNAIVAPAAVVQRSVEDARRDKVCHRRGGSLCRLRVQEPTPRLQPSAGLFASALDGYGSEGDGSCVSSMSALSLALISRLDEAGTHPPTAWRSRRLKLSIRRTPIRTSGRSWSGATRTIRLVCPGDSPADVTAVLIHPQTMLTAGHFAARAESFGTLPPWLRIVVSFAPNALDQSTWIDISRTRHVHRSSFFSEALHPTELPVRRHRRAVRAGDQRRRPLFSRRARARHPTGQAGQPQPRRRECPGHENDHRRLRNHGASSGRSG